jgi:VIT1/CCC1 family predicted Fe2+/Mn2+ transporter
VEHEHDGIGSAWTAALSSFLFFASGALVPVIPYLVGSEGFVAVAIAAASVGVVLLATGTVVGLLSGGSLWRRAVRQLVIGLGAAAVTYLLGLTFGTVAG